MESQSTARLQMLARQKVPTEKIPGHWLLAKMGKRVLRPGGLDLTRQLLKWLAIGQDDEVVEFAPDWE